MPAYSFLPRVQHRARGAEKFVATNKWNACDDAWRGHPSIQTADNIDKVQSGSRANKRLTERMTGEVFMYNN